MRARRSASGQKKKRGDGGQWGAEEILRDTQRWVDWQLVRFTEEDLAKHQFRMPLGLTHLPALVERFGVVPELMVGFTTATDADLTHKNFETNPAFIAFLHETINEHLHASEEMADCIPASAEIDSGHVFALIDDRKGFYATDEVVDPGSILTEDSSRTSEDLSFSPFFTSFNVGEK